MDRHIIIGKLKLFGYRNLFRGFGATDSSDITATEALSADVIRLLGNPSVSEFADFVGISQPNATYKVKNLVKKGYLSRIKSSEDKRECRLQVNEKFESYRIQHDLGADRIVNELRKYHTQEEIETAGRVIDTACEILRRE